jgi:hypothetical protein
LAADEEQYKRWAEHFKEFLNCTNPLSSADPTPAEDIRIDPPTLDETQKAIKSPKDNKAAGIDSTNSELLKADISISSRIFHNLFTFR